MRDPGIFTHWYYHLPDMLLAVLMWLLLARLVLSWIVGSASADRLSRLVRASTKPVVSAVAAVTPRLVPNSLVLVFAACWLLAARIGLFFVVSAAGIRLSMG